MSDGNYFEENILVEENIWCGIEAIQEKTSYHLSKLFDYFGEEEQEKII